MTAELDLGRVARAAPERLAGAAGRRTPTATRTSARASWARTGIRAFLGEPRFEGLPVLIEVPGPDGHGPDKRQVEIELAKRLTDAASSSTTARRSNAR